MISGTGGGSCVKIKTVPLLVGRVVRFPPLLYDDPTSAQATGGGSKPLKPTNLYIGNTLTRTAWSTITVGKSSLAAPVRSSFFFPEPILDLIMSTSWLPYHRNAHANCVRGVWHVDVSRDSATGSRGHPMLTYVHHCAAWSSRHLCTLTGRL